MKIRILRSLLKRIIGDTEAHSKNFQLIILIYSCSVQIGRKLSLFPIEWKERKEDQYRFFPSKKLFI